MFFRYLWKKKWFLILYVALAVAAAVSTALLNLYVIDLFDAAKVGKFDFVVNGFIILFVWFVATRLGEHFTRLTGIHITNAVRRDIKHDLFSVVISKQIPDYADRNAGEYIAEFTNDITMIERKFVTPCLDVISYVITTVTVGVAIFTIDYRMALVILLGAALCFGLPFWMTKYTSERMIRFITRFDRFVQHLKDMFGAFFTFKNYAVEKEIVDNFAKENTEVEQTKFKAELSLVTMNNLLGRLAWAIEILVVIIGLLGVIYGDLSVGSVFAAFLLAGELGRPLQSFSNQISMMRSVKGIEKKFKALGMLNTKIEADQTVTCQAEPFDVKLNNVSLTLKENQVLNDVSLSFEHGKKYLILGGNGSGKSTTAKLLKNNYHNYTGDITLGEYNLNSPQGVGLTRLISYSNEAVSLLSDTVRNNILLYRDVPEHQLEKAVSLAELNVPLDRPIGDGGRFLSSGERRKLEIARALVEEPQILILDEVVSTLDIETAYEIENLVLSLKDCTVVMISNAFSGKLLNKYDQIIMMSNGSVLAQGTHRELLENSPEYREVYQLRCVNK